MAAGVEIRPVRSKHELDTFIKLPFRLYEDEPNWVAPLIFERKQFLDRSKNPFFEHADAEYFLAYRDGRAVGRITAQVDFNLHKFQGNKWGQFGFFECEDDPEAAGALLDAARGWLEERGYDRMVGPFDNTMNDEAGVLIEGFELKPMIKQPWQHPYYQDLLEGAGMAKAIDLFMWSLQVDKRSDVAPMIWQVAEQAEKEHGITLRHMRKKRIQDEVKAFVEIYNAAWQRNWGFTPMREEDFAHAAKEMKPLLSEDWIMACEDRDGRTIAVALTVPDFNQAFSRANGRLL